MHQLASVLTGQLSVQTGTIVDFDPDGRILVRTEMDSLPIRSQFLRTTRDNLPILNVGDTVLLAFDPDRGEGLVLGAVGPYTRPDDSEANRTGGAQKGVGEVALPENAENVRVRAAQIHLDAGEEIQLTCGGGIVRIDKRGKIVVRGTDVVSRARRSNKIKGASVAIN